MKLAGVADRFRRLQTLKFVKGHYALDERDFVSPNLREFKLRLRDVTLRRRPFA
jgi:hypothetical protein